MSTVKKSDSFLKIVLRVVPLQFRSAPWLSTASILLGVVNAQIMMFSVVATQVLFDAVAQAAQGQAALWDCMNALLIMSGVLLGQQVVNSVHNFMGMAVAEKSPRFIKSLLHRKMQRIDPAMFEDTAFLDDVSKAKEGASVIPFFITLLFIIVSFYLVYFASIGVYLFRLKPLLLITLFISFVPALFAQIVHAKLFTKLEGESAPLRREHEYYQRALCDREYFKETRTLGAFQFFHGLFHSTLQLLASKQWQTGRKSALLYILMNLTTFAGMALSAYLLFTATMEGAITVGAFAAVFRALDSIFAIMQEIVTFHLGRMSQDIGKVANYIHTLDAPERAGAEGVLDLSKGVVAQSVSFTYPGRDKPAVRNVSLAIAPGETIAIVGENGAGKSTLVRLLTGLYRPTEGSVSIGGLDGSRAAPVATYKGISGVFQKFQRYKMMTAENVTISDVALGEGARLRDAMAQAQLELEGDVGLDTMLSPEFGGVDLSGGQWQRLAIARGLYRESGFIVLDEPTSAIDPLEESAIYQKFQQLAKGKVAVVVTHRLGSVKLAQRIVVMDEGSVVGIGTHEELLARPGKYADMWKAQAQWYERASV